jgi:hypothetical protein
MRDDKQKSQTSQKSGKSLTREDIERQDEDTAAGESMVDDEIDDDSDDDSELEDDDMDMDDDLDGEDDDEGGRMSVGRPDKTEDMPMSAEHEVATAGRATRDDGDNDDKGELK